MQRRVASQSDVCCHNEVVPDYDQRSKSQDWLFSELVETSQILLDERTSAKRFRQLYSHLKFAHTQLQESYAELESRYTESLHEWLSEKKYMKSELAKLSAEKHELELLCCELQKSVLSPEVLELIKCEVKNELQKKTKVELTRATEEVEIAKTECLNVTTEFETLKAEYEQLLAYLENTQEREVFFRELERQHVTESQEEVISRLSSLLGSDTETLAALYRENSQMCAQYHLVVNEAEKSKRLYDTQMSELKNELIRAIERLTAAKTDRETLAAKCKSLSEEMELLAKRLVSAQTDLKAARQRVVDCERARLSSEKHLEGRVHCLRMELNNYRLVAQRERVEIERQRDELAFQVQDLTNQIALSVAKFEEAEVLHQQREQGNLSKKDIAQILAESETLKSETQKKLSVSEAQNSSLKDELAMVRHELRARQNQIQSLECALKEITSVDDQLPEKDEDDGNVQYGEMTGIREAYLGLLKKFKSQRIKLTGRIGQLNAELIAKSYEAERHRQETEKLRDCVPQAEYQRVKSQLKEFQRRKESYWFLLRQANQILRGGHSD
ncbi:hypothetical protein TcWFU_007230 [Taenia crassiceps]|uniref:Uncharacterized protein n=1 Tax=Taenia crassiceps TaxID=6207 RepID=A0ABR4QRP1_9CEST